MDRFPPLAPDALTEEQRAVVAAIASGPRGGVRGPFIALLHNPALTQPVQALGEYLRFNTKFPPPLLELAILTVGRHWNCEYEWYAHEKIARKAGLAPAIIDALAAGRIPDAMSDAEQLIHAFCAESLASGSPSDAVYARAEAAFGKPGVLDLLALCGYYTLLALVLNTARPAIPGDGGTPLSKSVR